MEKELRRVDDERVYEDESETAENIEGETDFLSDRRK